MKKKYLLMVLITISMLFSQNLAFSQINNSYRQPTLNVVNNKQILLKKIDLNNGTTTTKINSNIYVSYRSGNIQKFWSNIALASTGIVIGSQLNNSNTKEGSSTAKTSSLIPLGLTLATLPNIWKNRPRAIPDANFIIQHRDSDGKVLKTWSQPVTKVAKNDAELLSITVDEPLKKGTLDIYIRNNSKNDLYYWGSETDLKIKKNSDILFEAPPLELKLNKPSSTYFNNDNKTGFNPLKRDYLDSDSGNTPSDSLPSSKPIIGCPIGYFPNGFGKCCTRNGDCINDKTGTYPKKEKEIISESSRSTEVYDQCEIVENCFYWRERDCYSDGSCSSWSYYSDCSTTAHCPNSGGGGTSGGSVNNPTGFEVMTQRINRPERRFEAYNDKCAGLRAMWEYSFRNNDPVLTKEMGAILTTTGKVIILPSFGNYAQSVLFSTIYNDEQGRIIVNMYPGDNGNWKVQINIFTPSGLLGDYEIYDVAGLIHTHPYTREPYKIKIASDDDLKVAEAYPTLKHYILTQDTFYEYNAENRNLDDKKHNCP